MLSAPTTLHGGLKMPTLLDSPSLQAEILASRISVFWIPLRRYSYSSNSFWPISCICFYLLIPLPPSERIRSRCWLRLNMSAEWLGPCVPEWASEWVISRSPEHKSQCYKREWPVQRRVNSILLEGGTLMMLQSNTAFAFWTLTDNSHSACEKPKLSTLFHMNHISILHLSVEFF